MIFCSYHAGYQVTATGGFEHFLHVFYTPGEPDLRACMMPVCYYSPVVSEQVPLLHLFISLIYVIGYILFSSFVSDIYIFCSFLALQITDI